MLSVNTSKITEASVRMTRFMSWEIHLGFFILYIAVLSKAEAVIPKTFRSTVFDEYREAKMFTGITLTSSVLPSRTKCGIACNKHNECMSFNFCHDGTCELKSQDIYSFQGAENSLQNDNNCKYFGMSKLSSPKCAKNGHYDDIQDDANSGDCNMKRVDREWGSWETADIDSVREWKVFQRRNMVTDAAHGGITGSDESERVTSWFKFVHDKMTWSEAEANCLQLGGKLFHNVDGSKSQLEWFLDKMTQTDHWLGIYREGPKGDHVWKNVDGGIVDGSLLKWRSSYRPNYGDNYFVANTQRKLHGTTYKGLNDYKASDLQAFVCDIKM